MDEVRVSVDAIIWSMAIASATYVRLTIGAFRNLVRMPSWVPSVAALALGILFAYLGQLALGVAIDVQRAAQVVLAGVVAGAIAVGSNMVDRRGDQVQEGMRQP